MSPWIFLAVPWLVLFGYLTERGFRKNQFRAPYTWGWHHYRTGSFDWWSGTVLNLMFLGSGLFMSYEALFHGTQFDREPVLPMPHLSAEPTKRVHAPANSQQVALCIAGLNHGQAYRLGEGHWRVAVRNGRGAEMYTFEVVDDLPGSRLDIYRLSMTPFVNWHSCLSGGGQPADGIIVAQSPK